MPITCLISGFESTYTAVRFFGATSDAIGNVTVISAGPKGVLSADLVNESGPHGYSDTDGPTDNYITVGVVNPPNGMPVDKYIGGSHGPHLLSRSAV